MKLLCWDAGLPTSERFDCCDRGLYIVCAVAGIFFVVFHSFLPRNGHRESSHRKWTCAIWGLGNWFQGFLKGLCPTVWPQQKYPGAGNENVGFRAVKGLCPTIWRQRATKKSSHRKWEFGAWVCEIVLGSFQALASHYLAATGHQKIQPQEMRIWGLGLRTCFREFSGACVPLSGRSRPPKNPATGNENPGLGLAKLF